MVQAASEDLAWVCGPTAAKGRVAVARNHVENHDFMLSLTLKSKEVTFAIIAMITGTQLKRRHTEGFYGNPYSPKLPPPKCSDLNRKCGKKAEVDFP